MASQAILNQSLFEDQDMSISQLGFLSFPQNFTTTFFPYGCNQPLIRSSSTLTAASAPPPASLLLASATTDVDAQTAAAAPLSATLLSASAAAVTLNKHKDEFMISNFGGSHLLSLQRSAANLWAWGGDVNHECMNPLTKRNGGENNNNNNNNNNLGISAIKMKKIKARRKVREPRFCFKTLSDVDVLDDGYKWRKYGQKVVKNTQHPRSYYRCTQDNCRVKKRVERLAEDPRMVITTYEGRHIHSPSRDEDDSQPSSQINNFFW